MIRRAVTALFLLAVLGGCTRDTSEPPAGDIHSKGPPSVQLDVVRKHALQFDVDLPSRPPGSQLELAAASYIVGNLQLGGYSARLDRVPVADAVSSTNVVAFPPSGVDPEFLVTISYDTPSSGRVQMGPEIGLFLELARALTVADPDHAIGFVALGAETADQRGTRRLAQFLLDQGIKPSVISIRHEIGNDRAVNVFGSCMGRNTMPSTPVHSRTFTDGECIDTASQSGAISSAGFQETRISGDIDEMARALFEFLTRPRS